MVDAIATVFVIDDDPSIRVALGDLFASVGLRVELFGSPVEFLRATLPDAPSCLVLDVRLPGKSGLDFQHELNAANVRLPIIFLTGHGDIPMSVRAMRAGAIEFLTKPVHDQDLLDAVQLALQRDDVARAEARLVALLNRRYETLTRRERVVMALLTVGRRNKQIAAELGTSEVTIKVHRTNLMRKMEAASLVDLVAMAARLGLPGAELVAPGPDGSA